jgi:adenosylhomocysteinase
MTATGVRGSLPPEAIDLLPDGALLANAGGIDDEFDVAALRERASEVREARPEVEELVFEGGRSLFVVGGGVVVNLSAGEGHPVEIMDLTFAVQALSARYLLEHGGSMAPAVHPLPPEIDEEIARMKLDALGLRIDSLTETQQAFLRSWEPFA